MTKHLQTEYDRAGYMRPILPELEFAVKSCGLSRRQALIELGFPEEEVDRLMAQRENEDVVRSNRGMA